MLYAIVFLSGAVLMALEMLGSRLLAPTFGSSIHVWGALITTVMAALTLGYYLGGKAADRRPRLAAMGAVSGAAGLFVGFLPFWTIPASRFLGDLGPRTGSLLASLSFFFPPSVLLAMISPYGIKLASRSLTTVGHTAGRMAAVSSAGSILGTLVTSFFLIPALGVRNIVHTLGLILLLLAAAAFIADMRRRAPAGDAGEAGRAQLPPVLSAVVCLLSAAAVALAWRAPAPEDSPHLSGAAKILYTGDSLYHHIVVDEAGGIRHLHFDDSFQSAVYPDDPLHMVFAYTSYLHLGVVANPRPRRALFIGLGGGSAPTKFLHDYSSLTTIDAVEIDPRVVTVARKYFMLPDDRRLRLHAQDGRLFVERAAGLVAAGRAEPYDLIVIDAFNADAIPYHLTTKEFLTEVRAILGPGGVVAVNIIGCLDGEKGRLLRAMSRTFVAVFRQVYLFPIGGAADWDGWYEHNNVLLATLESARRSREDWLAQAGSLVKRGWIKEDVREFAGYLVDEARWSCALSLPGDPLLTDDYAPVDTLQHGL